jgi:hypothetical protein
MLCARAMKWLWIVLFLLLSASGCKSNRDAPATPVAAEPAACSSATAAACGPTSAPTSGSASGIDPAQSEVCKRTCATKEPHAEQELVPAAQATVGELTRCPVSGVVFRVSAESPQVEYSGRKLRVCCGGCAEKFREQPARFGGG